MNGIGVRRWTAVSGLLGAALGVGGAVCERPWPAGEALPGFLSEHRGVIAAQSMFFVLSACVLLVFVSLFREVLRDAGAPATVAFGAGVMGYGLNIVGQAPQLTLVLPADGAVDPRTATLLDGLGLTMLTVANAPIAVMFAALGVAVLRIRAIPGWLGWVAMVAAAAAALLTVTVVAPTGLFDPQGWMSYSLYPVFIVWLVATCAALLRPTDSDRPAHRAA